MCEVRSREKGQEPKKKKKVQGSVGKSNGCDEPRPASNEKSQPIQWTEWPTGALVAAGSLWPLVLHHQTNHMEKIYHS